MKTNFSLLFYLKKPKNYSDGPVPIYLRITVAGKRAETATARSVDPMQWNSRAGRLKGTKEESSKTFNAYLEQLQTMVYAAHQSLTDQKTTITAERLKNKFTAETARMILDIFREHNRQDQNPGRSLGSGGMKR
ncbi:Arm DNA-binding domain-containing protein [Mucilaginibacter sp.]|uniref:Arm DNA-binding domain-containing protein n=1 Tax=Mucilaginibacter sp. TaxID=1882438 RepID=UPI00326338CB